ncbi:TrlF family AAA-like ATPase [Enterococcus casseliflavus]|uniref:ATPase n=1 Tax=Enterococcus casseliflavus TaxID=37734 RepID=A0AAW8UPT1_ENTCA|nr:ATPase [Enterococcus casseliflavus]MDT2966219.1 ATPase [Enterococcus casseliflavus]
MDNNRGSQFRKWDLHLHSLDTILNNNYNITNATSDELFLELLNTIKESNIEVVGLTNYFRFTDKDFQLKTYLEKNGIVVFMNLEVRLSNINKVDELFDYHIIFNDRLDEQLIKNLLGELKADIGNEEKAFNLLTKTEIEKQANISFDTLIKALRQNPSLKNKYLTGFLTRGHGSATSDSDSRNLAVYEKICINTDSIIHSSCNDPLTCVDPKCKHNNLENDRDYWLNKSKYVRPLLQSSDAHSFNQIGKKFSWIKAEKTFQGLKQILFEPEDRISLTIEKPQLEKVELVIDHISISEKNIYLSENLNAIIGGRSNGKSTLLNSIAKKLNKNVSDQNFVFNNMNEFKIFWKDGNESYDRQVEYIPQEYMFKLANNENELNILVNKIIRSRNLDKKLEEYDDECKTIRADIQLLLTEYFSKIEKLENLVKPDEEKETTLTRLEEYREKHLSILSESDFNTEEKNVFQQKKAEKEKFEKNIQEYELQKNLVSKLGIQSASLKYQENLIDESILREFSEFFEKVNKELQDNFKEKQKNINSTLDSQIYNAKNEVVKIEKNNAYIKGIKFLKTNTELIKLEELIQSETQILQLIEDFEHQKDTLEKEIEESRITIIDRYSMYKSAREKLESKFKISEIDLEISLKFKMINLYDEFAYINGQGNLKNNFIESLTVDFDAIISSIFNQTDLRFNNNKTIRNLIEHFFSTHFYDYDFRIVYQDDEFKQMSPGKKAFVILKLILEFSDSKIPVLIDQPEDSLDNRAIYNELTKYIKDTKKQRQIIIVTHNPNVVVGSDCENIIIANQHSNIYKNKNNEKFAYVNGGLENSFTRKSDYILDSQGIREHIFEILEGGKDAFEKREKKYNVK